MPQCEWVVDNHGRHRQCPKKGTEIVYVAFHTFPTARMCKYHAKANVKREAERAAAAKQLGAA